MSQWGKGGWGTGSWGSNPQELPPPKVAVVGNWGTGAWGCSTWGGIGGEDPPFIGGVGPALADTRGGTVLGIFGDNFADPMIVEIIDPIGGEVLGEAYYFEAQLDLRRNKLLAGFPPLPAGVYGVRITTAGGTSPVLPNAITYKTFAEEAKVHRVRRAWAPAWATGERLLS